MLNTKEYLKQLDATLSLIELDDEIAATCSGGARFYTDGDDPDVILYSLKNFRGDSLGINAEKNGGDPNLDNDGSFRTSGWNNRTSSILVIRGTWDIYQDSGHNATLRTLTPGSYSTPAAFGLPDNTLTGIVRTG